jgi:endonuclease/exonuclease/phosphatase family metal-dependent hydrolase
MAGVTQVTHHVDINPDELSSYHLSKPRNLAAGPTVVKLLTLNLGLLAWRPFGRLGVSIDAHIDERIAAAPAHLQAIGADIIALQEVYAGRHGRWLRDSLAETYPHSYAPRRARSVLGSGLMVLSRFRISRAEFVPCYSAPGVHRAISEKGCLCTDVAVPNYGTLRLLNLHLTVGGLLRQARAPDDAMHSFAQIDDVLSVALRPDRLPALLVGDFNCSPVVNVEIYRRIAASGYLDAFGAVAPPDAARNAVTWDAANLMNSTGRHRDAPSQRIDHVFVPTSLGEKVAPISSTIELTEPTVAVLGRKPVTLSDHYGLLVRLALRSKRTDALA